MRVKYIHIMKLKRLDIFDYIFKINVFVHYVLSDTSSGVNRREVIRDSSPLKMYGWYWH